MQKIHKNLIIAGAVVILIIIITLSFFIFKKSPLTLSSVLVKNGDITEKIELTGQVKASQGVELAFETSGKIIKNYVKTGDKIYAGQPLLAIDSSILQSQLKQAQAQLEVLNINTVQSKIDTNLQSLYANSISVAQKSASIAKEIIFTISDIQYNHFTTQNQQGFGLQESKEKAVNSLLGQPNAGMYTSQSIAALNGGAFGLVQDAINNPTPANIDTALLAIQTALQDINDLINTIPIDPVLTATERASINSLKASINSEIITTSANIQNITSQKVNNSATITTTNSQIEAAMATINTIKTQISKTVITALFGGQVDKNNVIVGQIISANTPVITISNQNLEIDTYIPEINLSGAKVGDNADITLDAFGSNIIFPATIVSIDSAPTMVNDISVYGAKLKFKDLDNKIKSGMTANITVISNIHKNVLTIPRSAVIKNNNKYFVIIDKGNSQQENREVNIGIHDDKNIEIISGLTSGEKILAY